MQNTPSEAKLDLFSNTSARLKEADPQGLMSKEGAQGPGSGMLNMALFQGETATQKEDIFKVKSTCLILLSLLNDMHLCILFTAVLNAKIRVVSAQQILKDPGLW